MSVVWITNSGKGFDLLDDNEYAQALSHLEQAAKDEGSKTSAVMASFLYLSDYQIPRDIDQAKEYYALSLSLPYTRWNQYLDYFTPLAHAKIMLYDDVLENDTEATDILRGERYSEYSPALGLLAKAYAFGKGVDKNIEISRLLFDEAVANDSYVYSAHHYAWWLASHPDAEFRDGALALELMDEVMDDEDEAERATTLHTMAAVMAENDRFSDAIDYEKRAIAQLEVESEEYHDLEVWQSVFECRLKGYQSGELWRFKPKNWPFSGESEPVSC